MVVIPGELSELLEELLYMYADSHAPPENLIYWLTVGQLGILKVKKLPS